MSQYKENQVHIKWKSHTRFFQNW